MHSRFYNYSNKAPADYKQKLEKSMNTYDSASDGAEYTQYTASFLVTILGIISGVLANIDDESPYKTTVYAFQIIIPIISAISSFIHIICKNIAKTAEVDAQECISEGEKDGFFNLTPSRPMVSNSNDPEDLPLMGNDSTHTDNLHRDAIVERILRRKPS